MLLGRRLVPWELVDVGADRLEQGQPDVLVGLEPHPHPHADVSLVRFDADEIGHDSYPGVLIDGHGGD